MDPIVKHLPSGWILIKFSNECFAQIADKGKGIIADEYIFNPEWNRERINNWRVNNEE